MHGRGLQRRRFMGEEDVGIMDPALRKLSIFKVRKLGADASRYDDDDDDDDDDYKKTKKAVVSLSIVLGVSILFNLIAIVSLFVLPPSLKQGRGKRKWEEKRAGRSKKATDGFKGEKPRWEKGVQIAYRIARGLAYWILAEHRTSSRAILLWSHGKPSKKRENNIFNKANSPNIVPEN